jgi:hypothetical protein
MKHFRFTAAVFMILLGLATALRAQDQSAQYLQAGNTFYSQKSYDQAIRYYQAATQMNANSWQAYQGLGGCYYAKGDNSNALMNYQKSLDINPNNPQVSRFVQYLRSLSTTPPQPTAQNNGLDPNQPIVYETSPTTKFELDVNAGLALFSSEIGFGGGLSAYIPLGKHFFIGASTDFYTISETESASASGYGVTETASGSGTVNFIEGMARVKYVLNGKSMKPYFFAGAGIVDASGSYSASASEAGSSQSNSGSLGSQIDPVLALGGGLQFAAGKKMDITVQLKECVVFIPGETVTEDEDGINESVTTGGGTESYTVLEGGLDFNL